MAICYIFLERSIHIQVFVLLLLPMILLLFPFNGRELTVLCIYWMPCFQVEVFLFVDIYDMNEVNLDWSLLFPGTPYTQQSYKVSESFPFKWINKKWKEGFHVTSMTTAGSRWGVVMSRNSGYSEQVLWHSTRQM